MSDHVKHATIAGLQTMSKLQLRQEGDDHRSEHRQARRGRAVRPGDGCAELHVHRGDGDVAVGGLDREPCVTGRVPELRAVRVRAGSAMGRKVRCTCHWRPCRLASCRLRVHHRIGDMDEAMTVDEVARSFHRTGKTTYEAAASSSLTPRPSDSLTRLHWLAGRRVP